MAEIKIAPRSKRRAILHTMRYFKKSQGLEGEEGTDFHLEFTLPCRYMRFDLVGYLDAEHRREILCSVTAYVPPFWYGIWVVVQPTYHASYRNTKKHSWYATHSSLASSFYFCVVAEELCGCELVCRRVRFCHLVRVADRTCSD